MDESEPMKLENEQHFCRIFSVDPGLYNIGLCVMDGNWRILELRRTPLPSGGIHLEYVHRKQRVKWHEKLAQELDSWFACYVTPRLPLEGGRILIVVEENDLTMTKDWCATLAGLLTSWADFSLITVIPKQVAKWMYKQGLESPATRSQKKRFAMEMVGRTEVAPGAGVPMLLDEHSADACVNALYVRERFYTKR
jgi:hypothetical protein